MLETIYLDYILPSATKYVAKLLPALAILLFAGLYILTGKTQIEIQGNNLSFDLGRFDHCEVTFQKPVHILAFGIRKIALTNEDESANFPISAQSINRDETSLQMDNPYSESDKKYSNPLYRVFVNTSPSINCEIVSISINGTNVDLKSFYSTQLRCHGELIKTKFIRKALAGWIIYFNDTVSNWILTILLGGLIALTAKLASMEITAYFLTDKFLKNKLIKFLKIEDFTNETQRVAAFNKYAAYWDSGNVTFRFLQALGPAMGFILTVSSLIAALDPSLLTANDINGFLRGIHVAMISTFLGLNIH